MTGAEYTSALLTLRLDHQMVAEKFGIGVRSSYRYAREGGAPKILVAHLERLLDDHAKWEKKRKRSALLAHAGLAAE